MNNDIKKLNEELQKFLEKDYIEGNKQPLYEFADLVPEDTNLAAVIWVDGPHNIKHSKRIKFQNSNATSLNGEEMIPITISDDPQIPNSVKSRLKIKARDLTRIKQWIILNKEVLLAYTNGDITTKQLYMQIKPLKN